MKKKNMVVLNRIIFVLSLIGVAVALYVLQSYFFNSQIVCLTNGCSMVRNSPYSHILGIPVPAFGLAGYALIAIFSFLRSFNFAKKWMYAEIGIATFGLLFVSWFTYTQAFLIHGFCTWCIVSTVNMFFIFTLSFYSYINSKR